MGQTIQLTAKDGHKLAAYRADPAGKAKGGIVIIQEIFGFNKHMREVADRWASKGYLAIGPHLFDRAERGVDIGYGEKDFAKGRETRGKLTDEMIINDVSAALEAAKSAGKVGIIGFCFGGYVTWLSATSIPGFACASGYYGGGIAAKKDLKPMCPVQLHFGDRDAAIPLKDVDAIKAAQPDVKVFVYDDAPHGFCTDDRPGSWQADACKRATGRSEALMAANVG